MPEGGPNHGLIIRCTGKRHAILLAPNVLEVKCDSRVCGAGTGVVVLHQFNLADGTTKTLRVRDPGKGKKVNTK